MASCVSIVRAQDAPHFVVYAKDEEIGRFGSLGAAFEAAHAAGGEISDDQRSCVEHWLLGARREELLKRLEAPPPLWASSPGPTLH